MRYKAGPTRDRLIEAVAYDPLSGVFTWLPKPSDTKDNRRWNSRHAHTEAGAINPGGYRDIRIDGVMLKAHRLAWLYVTGVWPDHEIDHKNGNPSDNRFCNLRAASHVQNMTNVKLRVDNKSGFKGVCREGDRWLAYICSEGKMRKLGRFSSPEDAHAAYLAAAEHLHGEFMRAA